MRAHKDEGDPALRPPMPRSPAEWPDQQQVIYPQVARLSAIRKMHPALQRGRYAPLEVAKTAFSFLRQHEGQVVIVALNSGEEALSMEINVRREDIGDGAQFNDILGAEGDSYTVQAGKLRIDKVYPGWGRILVRGE